MPFLVYLVFNVCYCSPKTELLGTVMSFLSHCSRFYSNADRYMAENLIVCLEVAVDFVHGLDDSLDRGTRANAERKRPPKLLVREFKIFPT